MPENACTNTGRPTRNNNNKNYPSCTLLRIVWRGANLSWSCVLLLSNEVSQKCRRHYSFGSIIIIIIIFFFFFFLFSPARASCGGGPNERERRRRGRERDLSSSKFSNIYPLFSSFLFLSIHTYIMYAGDFIPWLEEEGGKSHLLFFLLFSSFEWIFFLPTRLHWIGHNLAGWLAGREGGVGWTKNERW